MYKLNIIKKRKETLQKELMKDINIFLRMRKKRNQQYRCERYKSFQNMKTKSLLDIEKNIMRM